MQSFNSFAFEQKCIEPFVDGVSKTEMIEHQPGFAKLTVWMGTEMDTHTHKVWCNINDITNVYVRFNNSTEKRVTNFGRQWEIFYRHKL